MKLWGLLKSHMVRSCTDVEENVARTLEICLYLWIQEKEIVVKSRRIKSLVSN